MKPLTSAPKGTKDVNPAISHRWQYVEKTFLETAELYGFSEIRTPVFEHTELFTRSVGETTDVVQKEMYTFKDKGDRSITLRPEGTAGVLRAAIENSMLAAQLPLKVNYNSCCFRYEKPQAGRLRQFHQLGIEMIGSLSPAADADVIAMGNHFLETLGVSKISLNINSIGCPDCRPAYNTSLRAYFEEHVDTLCSTCKERLVTNPLRIIDCKSEICSKIAENAPKMINNLCDGCEIHFANVKTRLDAMEIKYTIDPNIVRGLDYYVKTVFEFVTSEIGAQGTVCGGGRYDTLIEQLGGPALPGIGFGLGIERLLLVMDASGAEFPEPSTCDIYIAPIGGQASVYGASLAYFLRRFGVRSDCDSMGRSLKAQMKYADKLGALFTLVLGDDEIINKKATVKNMKTGEKTEIALDDNFSDNFSEMLIATQLDAAVFAAEEMGK